MDFFSSVVIPILAIASYTAVAVMSYGPYGLVESTAGYAGSETPSGDYQARHATRAIWLGVAALWPLTLSLAFVGYLARRAAVLAAWLRQEV